MKKILFLLLFLNIGLSVKIQAQAIEKIKILKVGTAELVNSRCEINLNSKVEHYYVILTPIEEFAELYVETKDANKFVVKSKNTLNTRFDFIVIEKQTKYLEVNDNIKKNK